MLHVPLAVLGDWYVMKLGAHVFGMKTGKCAVSLTSMLPLCICVCVCVRENVSNYFETCEVSSTQVSTSCYVTLHHGSHSIVSLVPSPTPWRRLLHPSSSSTGC